VVAVVVNLLVNLRVVLTAFSTLKSILYIVDLHCNVLETTIFVQGVWSADVECPADGTLYCYCVYRHVCQTTEDPLF